MRAGVLPSHDVDSTMDLEVGPGGEPSFTFGTPKRFFHLVNPLVPHQVVLLFETIAALGTLIGLVRCVQFLVV